MKTAATMFAVLAATALAACGGGGNSGGKDAQTSSGPRLTIGAPGAPQQINLTDAQRSCLQKNGAPTPSGPPSGGSGGPPSGPPTGQPGQAPPAGAQTFQRDPKQFAKMRQAFSKCGVQAPSGPPAGGAPANTSDPAFQASVKAFAQCMSDNGYTMPAPDFSGKGPVFDDSKVNRSDPKFTKASTRGAAVEQLARAEVAGRSPGAQPKSRSSLTPKESFRKVNPV
jgi:hypothetical protein